MKKFLLMCFSFGFAMSLQAQDAVVASASASANVTKKSTKETTMNEAKEQLALAEKKIKSLFKMVEDRGLIVAGKSESKLTEEIVKIVKDEFGTEEHWHKKIVRSGINTLQRYSGNPPDRIIQEGDIVFLDFGPNFDGWESDLGRTYVLGNDALKLKLKHDVEAAWYEAKEWYDKQTSLTGAEYFNYLIDLAKRYGWEFGGDIGGHIVGRFPHEQPDDRKDLCFDVHPDNHKSILTLDKNGNKRQWVLEIQFVDKAKGIGGFFEQLLN